jgi:5-formyltetrahydrofolate cyclo-ligase
VSQSKTQLREQVRASRVARTSSERNEAEAGLTFELLKLMLGVGARRIAAFLPTETEPPIAEFLELAHYQGVVFLTPRAHNDGTMTWVVYHPDHDQVRSVLGVPEIADGEGLTSPDALSRVELVLVPAAAVDAQGTRLGWGKGFYDRALVHVPVDVPVYAVTFDDEVVAGLPVEAHDHPVSGVVTPTRALTFG